jgi:hypothetical protein
MPILLLTRSVAHYQRVLAIKAIFILWQKNHLTEPLGNGTCNPVIVGTRIGGVASLRGSGINETPLPLYLTSIKISSFPSGKWN